jgi:hypothetical protein
MLGVYQIIPYPELPEIDKQKLNQAKDKLSWNLQMSVNRYVCMEQQHSKEGHTIAWKSFIAKLATLNRLPRIMASFLGENSSRFKVTDALTREFPTCNETPFL